MIIYKHEPKEEYFAFRYHGIQIEDKNIFNNSLLIVHRQHTAQEGDVVVTFDGKVEYYIEQDIMGRVVESRIYLN